MGVPQYYLHLIKKYNKSQQFSYPKPNEFLIDWLFIDGNGLFHPMFFKSIKDNPNKSEYDIYLITIDNILKEFDKLYDYVQPIIGVFIAVDASVPVFKMKQQRERRFKSVYDKKLFNNIKRKHGVPIEESYSNHCISPGTAFMDLLDKHIVEWIKTKKYKIMYSSCYQPAEGEHKLINYIRINKDFTYIIYGLDADLIFLSMTLNNVYLLRESNEIDDKDSNILKIIDISILKKCIHNNMSDSFELIEQRAINDYIFLCFLLGNDFIPHIYAISVSNDGIELLLKYYKKHFNGNYLLDELNINMDFLGKIINDLAMVEESLLLYKKKYMIKKNFESNYEKEMFKINNLLFKYNDPIKLNEVDYRNRFYKYYYGCEKYEVEEFARNMSESYLKSIMWTFKYYFVGLPSWEWYYPYDHAPFLCDINKYIIDLNLIDFDIGTPLNIYEQLLVIMPPQLAHLLPKTLQKLMLNPKSSLVHLYPIKVELDFVGKNKYWMVQPVLPPLEIELVKHSFNKYKDELTDDEKIMLCKQEVV